MAGRKKKGAPAPPAAAPDDPAARLERLMAAPILQPWTPRWQEPLFRTPKKPSLLGDRWRSVFAGVRAPTPRHIHSSFPPANLARPRTLSPDQARFTRPDWRPPVTEPLMRRAETELPPAPRGRAPRIGRPRPTRADEEAS